MTTNAIHDVKILSAESISKNNSSLIAFSTSIFNAIYYLAKEIIIMAKALSETRKRFYSYSK